jgi:hypothetical protein
MRTKAEILADFEALAVELSAIQDYVPTTEDDIYYVDFNAHRRAFELLQLKKSSLSEELSIFKTIEAETTPVA